MSKGLALGVICLTVSASAMILMIGRAGADGPIFSSVDMLFGSPGLEIAPVGIQTLGDVTTITAKMMLEGQQNWTAAGVVLDHGSPGDYDSNSVNSPSVIYDSGEYKMWYTGNAGTMAGWIMYANSSDGITWVKHGAVISPDAGWPAETNQVHFPMVINDSGTFKIWYSGYNGAKFTICYATSPDGLTWTRTGRIIDTGPASYDSVQAIQPAVILDGEYKMWYAGHDGSHYRIIYANSTNGVSWTKRGVALDLGTAGSLDDVNVMSPAVINEGAVYHMWYAGDDGINTRVFYATSMDSITWTKMGMVLDVGTSGTTDARFAVPGTMMHRNGSQYQMWYEGRQYGTPIDRIHYANMTGLTAPTSVDVDFYMDGLMPGDLIGSRNVQVMPNTPATAQINWIASPIGDHFIYAVTDPLDKIGETNELNNIAMLSVKVVGGIPVADAGPDQSVFRNELVWLNGTGSYDPNGDPLTYLWVQVGGFPLPMVGANSSTPVVIAAYSGVYAFELTVYDTEGGISTDVTNLTVTNRFPVANAGADQVVAKKMLVVLDGSGSSDPDMDSLSYHWIQLIGPTVTLYGADSSEATFVPNTPGTREFLLTADDRGGGSDDDTVWVNVTNTDPVADAGPDINAKMNTLVTLNGASSTDPDGDTLSFHWTQTGGPAAVLNGADLAVATFTPTSSGIYIFNLTVDDGSGGTDADSVRVNATNLGPTADAGPDINAKKNTLVTLNGASSSDQDGDALMFLWTQTSGPTVMLAGADSMVATFTPTVPAIYNFNLTVNDGNGGTDMDSVQVTVTNTVPVANAGVDVTVKKRMLVVLDGSGSHDLDGDAFTFLWTQTSGPSVTLSPADIACPSFTPIRSGLYRFRLNVTDVSGAVSSDIVAVNVTNSNPRAYAGMDATAPKKTIVTLDGKGSSDPDADPLTCAWTRIAGPNVIIVAPDESMATFTPLVSGLYTFELTVGDGDGGISVDTVQMTITNSEPMADAGPDKMARKNVQVSLDGSGSSDADGDVLAYIWTKTFGPIVTLAGQDTATPSFTPSSVGTYTFRLAVDDGDGGTDTDTVTVTVYGLNPVARMTSSKSEAEVGAIINFDASTSRDSDGSIEEYQFDYGDGMRDNLTMAAAAHDYVEPGIYTVTLTVIDEDGNSSSTHLTVKITAAPRNILADIWWLIAIIVILAANVVYFALEWRRWKRRAEKTHIEPEAESERSYRDNKKT